MTFDAAQMVRVAKRLQEATGYLELGMPQHALDCLDGLGDLGPLEAGVEFVRGEALRLVHDYDAAAASLKTAARKLPASHSKPVWFALSLCYRQAGDTARAIQSLARARGAGLRKQKKSP